MGPGAAEENHYFLPDNRLDRGMVHAHPEVTAF